MQRIAFLLASLVIGLVACDAIGQTTNFVDDAQPILRRHCYRCHGSKSQEGGLQLNLRDSAMGTADSESLIIVRHDANASLLIARLTDDAVGDIMPPDSNPLTQSEIDVLRRWIDDGAVWPDKFADAKHWAYEPIQRPKPIYDATTDQDSAGAIDGYIARRLRQKGIVPNPPLDRPRLLRRASLALIGIPPTPAEVTAFVDDPSPDAFEKVVDRLLRSPRYGERWAVPWLDLARYADSNGYQADQIRDNWAYRDWVIRAFNADMPVDQFVIDQIAGDLHPNPTIDQRTATGFHRMTPVNVEAGVHPEADRTNQIVDRVNTTATVFMGTTLECAQCHDHKYDPFTQKDYYRLFAYFNNTPLEVEHKSGVTYDFYGPKMNLPMGYDKQSLVDEAKAKLADLNARREETVKQQEPQFKQWVASIRELSGKKQAWQTVVPEKFATSGKEDFEILDDGAVLLTGAVPETVDHVFTIDPGNASITAIRVDLLTDNRIPGKGPGRGEAKRTNVILSELTCERVSSERSTNLELCSPQADFSQSGWDVSQAIDGDRKKGWAFSPQFGKPHWASFHFVEPVEFADGQRLRVNLGQYFGRGRVAGKPRISIYTGDPSLLAVDEAILKIASADKPSKQQQKKLRAAFDAGSSALVKIDAEITRIKKQLDKMSPETTLVMVEMEKPRETFVLMRGDYEQPAGKVTPGTPLVLPAPESTGNRGDRMALARWLTSESNPLLARVTVNRWWAEFFGTGLVSTPEDFGTQSEYPSHPMLLDWLARELIDSQWSMKHVHRQIVMSAAFGRASRVTPELLEADPSNRLLARGPRFRMPAETIRDNALAISGLLSTKMFGPPIMPYQPNDIWRSVGRNQPKWISAQNDDRFRRGVYVICKRAAPYPSFITFDAPDRGSCSVARPRTNTPLQALTLLNDPAYAEMALAFADRILSQAPSRSDDARIRFAMQLAVARAATDHEVSLLQDLLVAQRTYLAGSPDAIALRTQVAIDSMEIKSSKPTQLAAWFAVANAILNLDEVVNQ